MYDVEIHPKGTSLTGYRYFVSISVEDVNAARLSFSIELDTGSWITILPAVQVPKVHRLTTLHNSPGIAASGTYQSDISRLPFLRLNDLVIDHPVVEEGIPGHAFAGGLLGMDVLRHFHVCMDFPNKKMYLATDASYKETRSWMGLGFNAAWRDKTYTIYAVSYPSPASEAGLHEGDVIVTINGLKITPDSVEALRKAKAQWKEGTKIVVAVQRKGKEMPHSVELTLRKLL